jgi:CheY-like chemotaxis protein
MKNTFRVMFCDDEEKDRALFGANHDGSEFSITPVDDINALPRILADTGNIPDLLVLDLYHSIDAPDSIGVQNANEEIRKRHKEMHRLLEEVKVLLNAGFSPRAISILRELRENPRLRSLPVLLYTRHGMATINDEEMKEAISLTADWMPKGRRPEVERRAMFSAIARGRRDRHLPRDIIVNATFTIGSLVIGWLIGKLG